MPHHPSTFCESYTRHKEKYSQSNTCFSSLQSLCETLYVLTMDDIFEELLLHSFNFLGLSDLLRTEQVCKKWRRIARDTTLWRRMCDYAFMEKVMRADDAGKETFVKAYKQANNMWLGNCSVITLQRSPAPVLGVSKEKNLLVSATAKTVSVWNLDNMTCAQNIEDNYSDEGTTSKRLVAVKRGKAIFSSHEHTISVYNLVSKRRAGVLVGHTMKVSTMNWDNPTMLCTGSRDGTVRFWDTRTFACTTMYNLNERVRTVKPLPTNNHVTMVASGDGRISYYDMRNPSEPFEQLYVLHTDEGEVTGMKFTADAVLYSVSHTLLYKYDLETKVTKTFIDETMEAEPMKVMTCNESTVMVGYKHGIIKAYSNETQKFLYHLKVGREYANVITMMFDEGTLVFGLDNGVIGACDFDKGTFAQSRTNPATLPTSGLAYSTTPFTRHYPS